MRLFLLFLLLFMLPRSCAGFFDNIYNFVQQTAEKVIDTAKNIKDAANNVGDSINYLLDNPLQLIDGIKKKLDKEVIFKNMVEKIQQVISIDKIVNSLKEKINSQQTIEKIKKTLNFEKIFNQIVKVVKQKVNLQQLLELFNKLFSPIRKYVQQLFNSRSKFCDEVCQKWYNLPCFLVLNCEQKINEFKNIIILPVILLSLICLCCIGSYIFFVLSNCAKFIKCLLLPLKVILYKLKQKYRYRNHHRLQTQQDQQDKQDQQINYEIQPSSDAKSFNE